MLKVTKIVFSIIIVLQTTAYAKAERMSGSICDPRVPKINITEAIELTKKHHYSSGLSKYKIFVDNADLKCVDAVHYWKVGYRLQSRETGHIFAKVLMNGSVTSGLAVKDG